MSIPPFPAPDDERYESQRDIGAATILTVERAASAIATRAVAQMDEQLVWFRQLPADQRSWVMLVAQAGIAGFVQWLKNPVPDVRVVDNVFGAAPRELIRSVSLRRTVELVRVTIAVAEVHVPALGQTSAERVALRESLLRYSQEVAFGAATVYAIAAETRGAWDARTEAALIDGMVRGEAEQSLASRAAALNWDTTATIRAIVGGAPAENRQRAVSHAREYAHRQHDAALAAVQGTILIVVLASAQAPGADIGDLFTPGPVVYGPADSGLAGAVASTAAALGGYRVAHAWPGAPRPVSATSLLPERYLGGEVAAQEQLHRSAYLPLQASKASLLETLDGYLAHGGSLEPAARELFIHPNTMRYRLHRIGEITGLDPFTPRGRLALQFAVAGGRLAGVDKLLPPG